MEGPRIKCMCTAYACVRVQARQTSQSQLEYVRTYRVGNAFVVSELKRRPRSFKHNLLCCRYISYPTSPITAGAKVELQLLHRDFFGKIVPKQC